jgi:hypothetical protein
MRGIRLKYAGTAPSRKSVAIDKASQTDQTNQRRGNPGDKDCFPLCHHYWLTISNSGNPEPTREELLHTVYSSTDLGESMESSVNV